MWLKEEKRVSHLYRAASTINHELHKVLSNAEHHFNRLKFLGEDFTLDDLVYEMKRTINYLHDFLKREYKGRSIDKEVSGFK
jgi:hypothetical protein